MAILYVKDFVPIFVVCVFFSLLATAHRVLIPSKYSAVLQFKQQEDEKKTAQSTAIRVLYVMIGTLVLYQAVGYTEKQILGGIFVSCFLNVWPAVMEYHLLKIVKTKAEWLLLLEYLMFTAFSMLIAFITIRLFLPILKGDESIYWLDNQAVSFLMTLIALAIPVPVEAFIAKFTSIVVTQTIDTFHEEVYICERRLGIPNHRINLNKYIIDDTAKSNDLNYHFLETLIKLESLYRESAYFRLPELILTKYFSGYAIKKDLSVGMAQIKISTAQKVLRENPQTFVKNLCDDRVNIEVCGKYIKQLIEEYYAMQEGTEGAWTGYIDVFDYIACQYLGAMPIQKEKTVLVYSAVLRSALQNEPFYYIGSEHADRHTITIERLEPLALEAYNAFKENILPHCVIQKEIFVNADVFTLCLQVRCDNRYALQTIRENAQNYGMTVSFG